MLLAGRSSAVGYEWIGRNAETLIASMRPEAQLCVQVYKRCVK